MTPGQIAQLTDRQIEDIYFHPRKEGVIEEQLPEPQASDSYIGQMLQVDFLKSRLNLSDENVNEMKQKIKKKFGKE